MVKTESIYHHIKEGKEYQFAFNTFRNGELLLYYTPTDDTNNVDISIYSYKTRTSGFLHLYHDKNKTFQSHHTLSDIPPILTNFQDSTTHFVQVDKKSLYACNPDCILTISLNYNSQDTSSLTMDRISILFSSHMLNLEVGRSSTFTLEDNKFKYLILNLGKSLYEGNEALLFSLTSESERPKVYLNFSPNQTLTNLPTTSSYQKFFYGSNFQITNETLPENILASLKNGGNPMLIMGIITPVAGKYSISITPMKSSITQVYHGTQTTFSLPINAESDFRFNVGKDPELKFYLYKDFGKIGISFYICDEHEFNSNCLDDKVSIHTIDSQSTSLVYKIGKAQKVTPDSVLIFKISSQGASAHGTFVVSEVDEFASLRKGNSIWDEAEVGVPSYYKIDTHKDFPIIFDIYSPSSDIIFYYNGYYEKNLTEFKMKETIKAGELKHLMLGSRDEVRANLFTWLPYSLNFQTLYIAVKALKENSSAVYSINFQEQNTSKTLMPATLNFDTIPKKTTKDFYFKHYDLNYDPRVLITADGLFDLRRLSMSMMYKEMENDNIFIQEFTVGSGMVFTNTSELVMFKLNNIKGTFRLSIKNEKENDFNITVMVQQEGLHYIPLGHPIFDFQYPEEKLRIYEYIIPNDGILVTDVTECNGDIGKVSTSSLTIAEKKDFFNEIEVNQGEDSFELIDVKKGAYFVGMKPLYNKFAVYKLDGQLYDSKDQIPQHAIVKNSRIDFDYEGPDVVLTFAPLDCPNCTLEELKLGKVFYRVLTTPTPKVLNNAKCSIYNSSIVNETGLAYNLDSSFTKKEVSISIKPFEDSDTYATIEAYANITLKNKTSTYTTFYSIIEIPKQNKFKRIILIIMLPLLFITIFLGALMVYFYRKYRIVKERLNYELEDIRNVAHVTVINDLEDNGRSVEMTPKSKNYQNLVEEESKK